MREAAGSEAPQTLEGWYVLHDLYAVDWPALGSLEPRHRADLASEVAAWLEGASAERGDSALYSVLTQKGDLMLVHYRRSPEDLNRAELAWRQLGLFEFLEPTGSYFSVIEVSLYELTAMAHQKLAAQGLTPGSEGFDPALAAELEKQKARVEGRLFGDIPDKRYICFYPMNKRRGEQVNWYTLGMDERRQLMRAHGRLGHKFRDQVTQVISGSVGLDDWEWAVSLHADDALVFKKLIYEMRFDPASALYAEFGPFCIGIHREPASLPALLNGTLD